MTEEHNQDITSNKREAKTNVCHKLSKVSLAVTSFLEKIFYRQEENQKKYVWPTLIDGVW